MDLLVNKAIEEDLIGLLLASPDQYWDVQDVITSESFGDPTCGAFYSAIQTVMKRGLATLPFSVVSQHFHGECETPPGVYLALLKSKAPMGVAATDLVTDIEDMAIRRAARKMMEEANKVLADPTKLARATVQAVQSAAMGMLSASGDRGQSVGELAVAVWQEALKAQSGEKSAGIRTGLSFWDGLVGSMMPENLIVLGGGTAMGKTGISAQVAISLARRGIPSLYLTHEMSCEEITARFVAQIAKIPSEQIITGQLNVAEERMVMAATEQLDSLPLWIESPNKPTVAGDLSRAMYYAKRRGLQFVVVDHLGYVSTGKKVRDRFEALDDMVRDFKAAAKESKLPWLLLSHLNRNNQTRDNKRPIITDLFGASEIEKSADSVVFIHREQFWLERSEPNNGGEARAKWEVAMQRWAGRAELILAKRRGGKGFGTRECDFLEKLTLFSDIGSNDSAPPPEQISLL